MSEILSQAVNQALKKAYFSIMEGRKRDYDYFIQVARESVFAIRKLGHEPDYCIGREVEISFLEGEITLLLSFQCLDCPDRAFELYRLAEAFMFGIPSRVLTPSMPYLPPCGDLYLYFHMTPENEEKTASDFSRAVRLYGKLTDGGGAGAELLLQAALALRREERELAYSLAVQALDVGGAWITDHVNHLLGQIEMEEAQ